MAEANRRGSIGREIRWSMGLMVVAMVFIYSYFLLTYFDRGLTEATASVLRLEARAYAEQYHKDPATPLPFGSKTKFYKDWTDLPASFRQHFTAARLKHDKPQYIEAYAPDWWAPLPSEQWQLWMLLLYQVNPEQQIYVAYHLAENEFNEADKTAFFRNIRETLPLAVVFILLTGLLTYWFSHRINKTMRHLESWAQQLNRSNCKQSPPDFRYRETNGVAQRLQEAFLRVSQLVEREHYFLRHASHELRTPIAVTKASLELLNKQGLRDNQQSPFKRLQRANKNMQQLTETLLWSSRETTPNVRHVEVDVKALLQEQMEDLQYLLEGKSVVVTPQLPDANIRQALPETPLRIVFANLLRNAFQHTSQGTVSVVLQPGQLLIHNHDELPETEFQDESSFGLGLMLVQELCERLGWALELETEKQGMRAVVKYDE